MRVAVIGLGVIGKAQAKMFDAAVTYDPLYDDEYPYEELEGCDFAVVCAPTPQGDDGSAVMSYVEDAIASLPPNLPVLLRSTVPPGTSDRLASGTFCHAPEFMGENPAHPWQSPAEVPFMVLGGDEDSRDFFAPLIAKVYPGVIHETTALESELVKYVENLYWATRVTFVNEMANVCENYGADWENIRSAWIEDPRVSPDYTSMDGVPSGYGGRCWPKDIAALIAASTGAGYRPEFLEAVRSANGRFGGEL